MHVKEQKAEKYNHLKKVLENLLKNENVSEITIIDSKNKKSDYNTYLLNASSINKQYNLDELFIKRNILSQELSKLEDFYISEMQNTSILKHKKNELAQNLLDHKKEIQELIYFQKLSEKKLSNLDNVEFKAKETYVIFFSFNQ